MRTYKKEIIERKPEEREILKEIKCDLCGEVGTDGDKYEGKSCWGIDYVLNDIVISHTTGFMSPDGCDKETEFFDICPNCWESKIKPWFLSQGVNPQKSEIDW